VGAAFDQVLVDVSAEPNRLPDWTPRGQLRVALENGRRATTAEQVGEWQEAASMWERCANSWAQLHDDNRAALATTYLREASNKGGRVEATQGDLASFDNVTWAAPLLTRARVIPRRFLFDYPEH
jgi:hypothetical protein